MKSQNKEIEDFFMMLDIDTEDKRARYLEYGAYDKKDNSTSEVTFIRSEKESAIQEEI